MPRTPLLLFVWCVALGTSSTPWDRLHAQEPVASIPALTPGPDWLLNSKPYVAKLDISTDGKTLKLENGLIRRVFKLSPNAATVEYDNPATQETILRAVKPEAIITVNGKEWKIGGLAGQSCQNYLSAEMLEKLESPFGSYTFAKMEELPMSKPLNWKQHPEWLSTPAVWPVPGKHIVLHFAPPTALVGQVLFEEKFEKLDEKWKVHTKGDPKISDFSHKGQPGLILSYPDLCAYIERPWPADATSVEVTIDPGTDDRAKTWGPGLAFEAGGQSVCFVARLCSKDFEINEKILGKFNRTKPITLRARLEGKKIYFEAANKGEPLVHIDSFTLARPPKTLKIGKVGKFGNGKDYDKAEREVVLTSRILNVTVRAKDVPSGTPRKDLPLVEVHYEIYNGIPVISKWLRIINNTGAKFKLDAFSSELLAVVETAPKVDEGWNRDIRFTGLIPSDQKLLDHPPVVKNQIEAPRDYVDRFANLFVVTDYSMGGDMEAMKDNPAVHWKHDQDYKSTGIGYYGRYQPTLLECSPLVGPGLEIQVDEKWESYRTYEMLRDSSDRERRGLAECRFWATFAPWTRENPIYMHITFADPVKLRAAIDQCAECKFEMMILSFGSGFNAESTDPAYIEKMAQLAAYAKSKGIVLGGYSLLASRGGKREDLALTRDGNTPATSAIQGSHFGHSPCLATNWGTNYFKNLRNFYSKTGCGVFENDGSYPGDTCGSTTHSGHHNHADSQWRQWEKMRDFYHWCRAEGVYLTVPDWYFLNGSSKTAMGYVENNWSLPRGQQQIITRQNVYDGTFNKSPTMGWMFVPLTQYHGGGAAATVEPLSQHLDHYETQMASLFGAGVQACYRGPRLYDTDATKAVVLKWVNFYRDNRAILDSDLVHLRRADGRNWDGWLHVNPTLKTCGLAMLYNPLDEPIRRTIELPLYYTGLTGKAKIKIGTTSQVVNLDARQKASVEVTIPAKGNIAVFVEAP